MTPSADYMVNYREGEGGVRTADGRAMPIEDIGNLQMSFWSGKDWDATVAPGKIPSVSPVDINTFHTSHGHVHEKLLRSTAKQLGVVLEESLRECEGCSVAKGLGKSIGRTTSTRADKIFGRLLVEICEETSVESIGGKRYMLLICGDFSHFT